MKTVVTIPVYNQIDELPHLLAEIASVDLPCDDVLLVNNGSDDGSAELIHESGHQFIDVPENRGVGYALIAGARWAIERDYELFAVMAGNGKMLPGELHRVLDPILSGEFDYITGSRFMPGGSSPNLRTFRKFAIPAVNFFVRVVTGAKVTDATCGYAAYRLEILRRAKFDWQAAWLEHYGFEYFLRSKVIRDKSIRWKEVPITMRYPTAGKRYSKIKPFSGWFSMLRPWIRARFNRQGFEHPQQPERQDQLSFERQPTNPS